VVEGAVIAAVIALSVLALTLGGGLILAGKWGRDQQKRGDAAMDLYRAQQNVTDEIRMERDELVGKLAAVDTQLKEATIRLEKTEQQRNEALAEAREAIRKEIRSAPDAVAALNRVLAAAPGVQRTEQTKTEAAADPANADRGGSDPLLITELR
jgi:chromosome segregation ATPase